MPLQLPDASPLGKGLVALAAAEAFGSLSEAIRVAVKLAALRTLYPAPKGPREGLAVLRRAGALHEGA